MNRVKIGGWEFLAIFSILILVGLIAYFDLVEHKLSSTNEGLGFFGALVFAYLVIKRLLPDPINIDVVDETGIQQVKIFEGNRADGDGYKPVDRMNAWLADNHRRIRVHETRFCTYTSGGGTAGVIREVFVRYSELGSKESQ